MPVIFRSSANHRRPANVDILNRRRKRDIRFRHGCFKRIEVAYHYVNSGDAVRIRFGAVFRILPRREEPAVNFRMERLDSAIEQLRKAGVVRDINDVNPCFTEMSRRAAGGQNFHPALGEDVRYLQKVRFIVDAD